MTSFMALIWVAGVIGSVWFIVKPKPDWPMVATRGRAIGVALAVFIGLPVIAAISGVKDNPSPALPASPPSTEPPATSTGSSPEIPASKWQYSTDIDQMRGTKTRYASLESENEQAFGFPYDGGKATLILRQRPSDGLNILLEIKAQFLCNQFSNETVAAKFDDNKIETYSCAEPNDASTGVLFIEGASRFLSHLRRSKKLILEAPFYQAGRRQMEFDVRGLNWT